MDMRISNAMSVYEINRADKPAATGRLNRAEEKRDVVALSSQAHDYQTVRKALANTPDIREEKVSYIRSQMADDQYNVSSRDIADKLLTGLLI